MKKRLAAFAALFLLVTLSGCGGAAEAGSTASSSTATPGGHRVPNVTGETVADAMMDLSGAGLAGKAVGMAGEELAYGSIQRKEVVGVEPAPGTYTDQATVTLKVDTSTGSLGPTPSTYPYTVPKPVAPAPTQAAVATTAAPTTFSDGTYVVGKEMPAGTYKTAPEVKECYWSRLTGSGGTIANDFVEFAPDGVTVTVYAGEGFKSERCGPWTKVG